MKRRAMLQAAGALALIPSIRVRAADALPRIAELDAWLAGRVPQLTRLKVDLPRIADNGFAVPMRIAMPGPFAPGPHVKEVRVFSETNPVPDVAVFAFAQPVERVELDTRIRLAGTQHVVTVAEMTDGGLYANAIEVVVTLAGCMDGT
ncbi:MAG: thiosulfate oxidation carrier protein SoxY [Burkholderiales bacterium]|nr:thiosulfate oxidation carrier protein SoxY [Burkholderiales bacterium]